MQYMKYILNMCLIHLQSIKMKNRIHFKYWPGYFALMQYVWNMLNIILEVIETFHTHWPRVLCVCTACNGGTRDGHPAWGWRGSGSTNFPGSTNPPAPSPHNPWRGSICISQLRLNQINENPNLPRAVAGYDCSSFQHTACQSSH